MRTATRPATPYPQGGWRPASGIQRGSVADIPIYPGDPLTPGVGATADVTRLAVKDAPTLMKIPGAAHFMGGCAAHTRCARRPQWRRLPGAGRCRSPITWAPGAAKVHLVVKSDWSLKPIYDVIGTITGAQFPDEWVVRGNHHDGWVEGAWDPLAGAIAELAEARAIAAC